VSKEVTALDQLPDPWGECYRLAWDGSVIPTIEGPVSEPFGDFGAAIYLVRLIQRDPQDRVVEHHRRNHERDVAAAERMIDGGVLNRGGDAGARLDDMWPEIAELL
jgi:hypothetical protein